MTPERHNNSAHGAESGYALIVVMFFLALLVLSIAAAAPTVLSNIQREKETEMIWRGRQYARGIRLYYSKMKKYPTSLDDLTKPTTGIRFMRQAYKDPMNHVDGSWRLIYVGPNGQLIGSVNSTRSAPTNGTTDGSSTDDPSQPHSLVGPMDASNTIGGNIVGVGSKVNKRSFVVYNRAKNYKDFEFLRDLTAIGSASAGTGNPIQNMNGANPAGTAMPNSTLPTGSSAGDWVNQMRPGPGPAPQAPPPNQ